MDDKDAGELESASGLGALVPEFYFDLIARMIPGSLILAATPWVTKDRLDGVGSVLLLGGGYLLGLVLDVVGELVVRRPLGWGLGRWPSTWMKDRELWRQIRGVSGSRRSVLTKIMAERVLFCSLALGALLVLAFPGFFPRVPVSRGVAALLALLCLGVSVYFHWIASARVKEAPPSRQGVERGGRSDSAGPAAPGHRGGEGIGPSGG